jgi:hypothetical protein
MVPKLNESSSDEDLIRGALEGVKSAHEAFERDPNKWFSDHGPIRFLKGRKSGSREGVCTQSAASARNGYGITRHSKKG